MTHYTFYRVDLREFQPVDSALKKSGPDRSFVYVDRKDLIEKTTNKNVDFRFDSYTTGKEIQLLPISYPNNLRPDFHITPPVQPGTNNPNRIDYEYLLPMGGMELGRKEVLVNKYTYVNGFSNNLHELWGASTKYPTKAIAVILIFPERKPCKNITIYRQPTNSVEKIQIKDNAPTFTENGRIVYWMGLDEKADTIIWFQWDW